jgi:hypothetical protein
MVAEYISFMAGPGSCEILTATFNACGDFSKIRYEWKNQDKVNDAEYGCRAHATEKATGEVLYGPWITWKVVRAEKWDAKDGSKWKTIPELMFMYRAAAWFINTHCPEISMGIRTTDEIEDIENAKDITGSSEIIERKINFPPEYSGPIATEKDAKTSSEKRGLCGPEAPKTLIVHQGDNAKGDGPQRSHVRRKPAYSDQEQDPFGGGICSDANRPRRVVNQLAEETRPAFPPHLRVGRDSRKEIMTLYACESCQLLSDENEKLQAEISLLTAENLLLRDGSMISDYVRKNLELQEENADSNKKSQTERAVPPMARCKNVP